MGLIYHVTTKENWNEALLKGTYEAPSLRTEGFIHCSEAHQVPGVLKRYYSGKKDLVKLVLDTEKIQAHLKYELAPSVNEQFPHIFGAINLDAVIKVEEIQ